MTGPTPFSLEGTDEARNYIETSLDNKIKEIFIGEAVNKKLTKTEILTSRSLPSFVSDWLISKFSKGNVVDTIGLQQFLDSYLPDKSRSNEIKHRLISDGDKIRLLAHFRVTPDIKSGEDRLEIPLLDISEKEGMVDSIILDKSPKLLNGGSWGVGEIIYCPPESKQKTGRIALKKFDEFRPFRANLDYYRKAREQFTTDEWIDFLIKCMEYDPESFDSIDNKIWMICRLLPFVEPKVNLIELAPKGTGKSYVFGRLSQHGWLVSGGTLSRAQLFFDINKKKHGLIAKYDYVALDEIQTISFGSNPDEVIGALKGYLESGLYNVSGYSGNADSGFIILGNIEMNNQRKPISSRYFDNLPSFMQETAFLDRFHGFIEGWQLPRIKVGSIGKGFALNSEYFSEILHELRKDTVPTALIDKILDVPSSSDKRDMTAVIRISSGLLKLLFPNVRTIDDINHKEFEEYCFAKAVQMRGIIREQLHRIDDEFSEFMPKAMVRESD